MAGLNGNAWYQLTETRVDFNSSLQQAGNGLVMAAAGVNTLQYWQIFPVSNGYYQIRNKGDGINRQLGTCYASQEIDPSRTQPCMLPSSGDDSQLWNISSWGDGTYRFVNVGNGTGYNMDCHPGDPMFMSSTTAAVPNQPAQHWEVSSLMPINDAGYSVTISASPSSSSSSPSSSGPASAAATSTTTGTSTGKSGGTSSSGSPTTSNASGSSNAQTQIKSSSGLSTGASIGIGIAVGLTIFLLAAILLIFTRWRQRKKEAGKLLPHELMPCGDRKEAVAWHEMYVPPHELANQTYELGSSGSTTMDQRTEENDT